MARRIGILTGGGDVPGLNVVIKTFTARLEEAGCDVVGLRRGWKSLLAIDPQRPEMIAEWTTPLTRTSTRTIDRTGGTILHTSRTNPAAVAPNSIPEHLRAGAPPPGASGTVDLTPAALRVLEKLGLTALVAIGGDDTLSFARRLSEEGVPVVGIPKTMDNDVHGTDYCIGFSTAVTRSVNLITDLRSSAGSHERFLVVELFGRNSGETSLITALLASADRALISEVPFDPQRVVELLMRDKHANASNYAVVTVAEGSQIAGRAPVEWGEPDAYGHKKLGGVGLHLGDYIKDTTGEQIVYQNLAYLMRSGPADSLDRMVAINFARMAADLVLSGQTGKLTAIVEGRYAVQPIALAGSTPRRVNVDRYYDLAEYRPKLDAVVGLPMFLE